MDYSDPVFVAVKASFEQEVFHIKADYDQRMQEATERYRRTIKALNEVAQQQCVEERREAA